MPLASTELSNILTFHDLIRYLEEKLGWPLKQYGFDELTFEYQPVELGLKEEDAAKVRTIHQLRPLQHNQPWGIFFVEFENKKLPVVVLRRILSHLAVKKRASANKAGEAAWHSEDLMFITTFGEDNSAPREIAFAHFHQSAGDLPTLHVLGWDGGDMPLKLAHLDADLQEHLRWPENTADHGAWRQQWASPFRHRIGHIISTANALAEALAALARGINEKATRMLAVESENGPLRMLYKAFQTALIHDLTEEDFADTYAQTITYGLLTAAISRTDGSEGRHGTFIVAENVTDMVPVTNPFLKEMLQTFLKVGGRKGGIDFDELGIQDVVELLRGDETDLPAILRDFGNRTPGEDPVIHFYEHFLTAYNKKLKIKRGVFYTPQPVVAYIIRSVHELLQTEFGLEDGLASTITWGEMIKRHSEMTLPILTPKNPSLPNSKDILISPESPFVMILDIATGTGTFLVEVIDVIYKTMMSTWQKQGKREQEIEILWNDYVPKHLLPRLYGYELMMAPYAIAHMKIGLKLFETGYQFRSDERVRVYLTNTLEPASDAQSKLVGILPALAHEAAAVNSVKRNVRFTVVVGNPPYSGESANPSISPDGKPTFIGTLIREYFWVDGKPLGERNSKWLHDDYAKFIRFGEYLITESTIGILGYITNHSYIFNPTFRGMRQHMLKVFNRLHVLNLHGSLKLREISPDGTSDDNVFDIEPGVAIALGVHRCQQVSALYYGDLWGSRENKYRFLGSLKSLALTEYEHVAAPPFYMLFRQVDALRSEYLNGVPLTDIFPLNNTGIITKRDGLTIQYSEDDMWRTVKGFAKCPPADAYKLFALPEDVRDWSVVRAQADLNTTGLSKDRVCRVYYRPFDVRFTYYTGNSRGFIGWPVDKIMQHMVSGRNLAICIGRAGQVIDQGVWNIVLASRHMTEFNLFRRGGNVVFPCYLQASRFSAQMDLCTANECRPNLAKPFLKKLTDCLGDKTDCDSDLVTSITVEDVVYFVYAILYSPSYRIRYAEFLKIDFPRVPLISSLELFRSLTKLGSELVTLHLLESPKVNGFITRFTGNGDNSIPKKPTWKENAVWINQTQCFEGVPENVWNFQIGGYQVCEKWLKDRKGRTLSADDITHYQRIIVALNETIRIMAEIDQVIDEHGGWPIR